MDNPLRHSFGPGDITTVAVVPGRAFVLDEVQDFSVSTHVDQEQIRRLGHRLGVGWATGSGTIAGTLVCAQLTRGALWKLRRYAGTVRVLQDEMLADPKTRASTTDQLSAALLPQLLPPFHLLFVHVNQSGQMAIGRLYDVKITDQGEVKGAHNRYTEETLQYQALHYEQLQLHRSISAEELSRLAGKEIGFANDPRRTESLVDDLSSVLDGTGETTLQQLEAQTNAYAAAAQDDDQVTGLEITDQGNVVFSEPGDYSEPPEEPLEPFDQPNFFEDDLFFPEITIPMTEPLARLDGSVAYGTLHFHSPLGSSSAYLLPDDGDSPDTSQIDERRKVTNSLTYEAEIPIDANHHAALFSEAAGFAPSDLLSAPERVTFTVSDDTSQCTRRAEIYDTGAELTEQVRAGSYEAPGTLPGGESYDVTENGNEYVVEGSTGGIFPLKAQNYTAEPSSNEIRLVPVESSDPAFLYKPSGNLIRQPEDLRWEQSWPGVPYEFSLDNLPLSFDYRHQVSGGGSFDVEVLVEEVSSEFVMRVGVEIGGQWFYSMNAGIEPKHTFIVMDGLDVVVETSAAYQKDSYRIDRVTARYKPSYQTRLEYTGNAPRVLTGIWRGRDVEVTDAGGSISGTVGNHTFTGQGKDVWFSLAGDVEARYDSAEAAVEFRLADRTFQA